MYNIINGFSLFGLNIKFYGILMATAMLVGVLLACKNAKNRSLKSEDIFTLALYILPLAVIGARLVYVLGADHPYTFVEVFKIWEGGMSIYGGIIGGALGICIYCLIHKKNFLAVADVACVSLILGQAIGRWGNFFNQEVYGHLVTNPSWQWFPFAVLLDNGEWHYALFFYEFLINLAIFALLFVLLKKIKTNGYVVGTYLISYGLIRFLLEPLREATYNLMLFGLKLSSVISIISIVAGIAILIFVYTKQNGVLYMKKNKILLSFAILLSFLFVVSLFVTVNQIKLKQYWFSIACLFIGMYALLYCIMYKLDSSLYYAVLVISIGVVSFLQYSLMIAFAEFYPAYIICFALASFAVFAIFRQKIHFKLFAIFSIEGILLIVYKLNYLKFTQLIIINALFLLFVLVNAVFRIKTNLKEN